MHFDRINDNQIFDLSQPNENTEFNVDLSFLDDPLLFQNILENNSPIQEIVENLFYTINQSVDNQLKSNLIIQSLSILQIIAIKLRNNASQFFSFEYISSILLDLLYNDDPRIIKKSLELIQVLSQSCRQLISFLIHENMLKALIEVLNYLECDKESFHLILTIASNIASYSPNKIEQLFEFGFHNLIQQAIEIGNINCKIRAAQFLSNIMYKGTRTEIELVLNEFNINFLFEFLNEEYEDCLRHCILNAISKCIDDEFFIENKINVKEFIMNEQYVEILNSLASNDDESTADLAQCILASLGIKEFE